MSKKEEIFYISSLTSTIVVLNAHSESNKLDQVC